MAATPQKPTAKASPGVTTDKTPAADGQAPYDPRLLQPGEAVGAPVTTNPPRGVDELPANQIADEPAAAALQEHVQKTLDKEQERGYRGIRGEKPFPNKNYTLQGVGQGLPTPETTVVTPRGQDK